MIPQTEPLEHSTHVTTLLHGDHPHVILLVNPNQEVLLVVVPESDSQIIELHRSSQKLERLLKNI